MSYDAKLGYDPERPVVIRWEGDPYPETATVKSYEADDATIWFTVANDGDYPLYGGAPYVVTVPWSRIYSITTVSSAATPTPSNKEDDNANHDEV